MMTRTSSIGVGVAKGGDDFFAHPRGKGVELGRTVERDCRDRTVTLIKERFEFHRHVSCAGLLRNCLARRRDYRRSRMR